MGVLIYIRLDESLVFRDERLNVNLNELLPAAALDYTNINEHIFDGLNAHEIKQISQAEYFGIAQPPPPITVNTNYLITLATFQPPCPVDAFVLFGYYNQQWYKILWSTLRSCLSGASSFKTFFLIDDPANAVWMPASGALLFQRDDLLGADDPTKFIATLNGTVIYHISMYSSLNPDDFICWDIDDVTGEFLLNYAFNPNDAFSLQGI